MDQAHDIAHYFLHGLSPYVRGSISHIVEPNRDVAAIAGYGKDMPFVAIIMVGSPFDRPQFDVDELLIRLEESYYADSPVEWGKGGV